MKFLFPQVSFASGYFASRHKAATRLAPKALTVPGLATRRSALSRVWKGLLAVVLVLGAASAVQAEQPVAAAAVTPQEPTTALNSLDWLRVERASPAPRSNHLINEFRGNLVAWAEADAQHSRLAAARQQRRYRLAGANHFELAGGDRLTGWQVAQDWYFGRSKGELSGVALVWQRNADQRISLSDEGLRVTRRLR